MRFVRRLGIALVAIGVTATLVSFALALQASTVAPSVEEFFIPVAVVFGGFLLLMVVFARSTQKQQVRSALVWSTTTLPGPETSLEQRRKLQPLPTPALGGVLIAMVALLVAMFATMRYPQARNWGALREKGIETTGRVTKKEVRGTRHRFYSLEYRFTANGTEMTGYSDVRSHTWNDASEGGPIRVTYLSANPRISVPYGRDSLTLPNAFAVMFEALAFPLLLLAPLELVILLLRAKTKTTLSLTRDGSAAIGEITDINGTRVKYAFPAPAGISNGAFTFAGATVPRPEVGDHFVVLYDPKRPRSNVPWPIARTGFKANDEDPKAPVLARDLIAQTAQPLRFRPTWQLPLVIVFVPMVFTPFITMFRDATDLKSRLDHLHATGVETTGTITDTMVIPSRSTDHLRVRYAFQAGPRHIEASFTIRSYRLQQRFSVGAATPVTYAKDDPEISLPVAKKDLDSRQITADVMVGIPAGAIMGIFGLGFVAYTFKQAWQEWILTKRGKIAIAEIESVDKSLFRRIRYRFMSAHGDSGGDSPAAFKKISTRRGRTHRDFVHGCAAKIASGRGPAVRQAGPLTPNRP